MVVCRSAFGYCYVLHRATLPLTEARVFLRQAPRGRPLGIRGVEVVGRDTPSTSRHPRPRSGTYARVILAPDPGPTTFPSFRPPSRYPWAGRGNHHLPHPHPSTVMPAKERHPVPRYGAGTQGARRGYPPTLISHQHPLTPYRRAGVGRYPGARRGYHHNRHPPPPPPLPSCRRRPVPRGRARLPP